VTIPFTRMLLLSCALLYGCSDTSPMQTTQSEPTDWPDLREQELDGEDLSASQSPCLAAQGISGTLLKEDKSRKDFCVDFDKAGLTDTALSDAGWTLAAGAIGCSGFTITNGRLTIKAPIPGGDPECKAGMPKLVVPSHPQKVFVAIVHDAALEENTQAIAVSVNTSDTQNSGWTGKNVVAPQKSIQEFSSDGTLFSGFLRAKNTNNVTTAQLPKWKIQSIAVFSAK
jgi:hypothetical protein